MLGVYQSMCHCNPHIECPIQRNWTKVTTMTTHNNHTTAIPSLASSLASGDHPLYHTSKPPNHRSAIAASLQQHVPITFHLNIGCLCCPTKHQHNQQPTITTTMMPVMMTMMKHSLLCVIQTAKPQPSQQSTEIPSSATACMQSNVKVVWFCKLKRMLPG